MTTRRRIALGGALGLYFVGLGFLGGMALERMRFDRHRDAVLRRYDEATQRLHNTLMTIERNAQGESSLLEAR